VQHAAQHATQHAILKVIRKCPLFWSTSRPVLGILRWQLALCQNIKVVYLWNRISWKKTRPHLEFECSSYDLKTNRVSYRQLKWSILQKSELFTVFHFELAFGQNTKVVEIFNPFLTVKFEIKRSYRLPVMNLFLLGCTHSDVLFTSFNFKLCFDHLDIRIKLWSKHKSCRDIQSISNCKIWI
jgi:hypothetical protein